MLINKDYKKRNDVVAKIVHSKLAFEITLLKTVEPYYAYNPQIFLKNFYNLYWNRNLTNGFQNSSR